MSQGDRTHVGHFTTPAGDTVEILDVEGPPLPHGALPHQMRQVWIAEEKYRFETFGAAGIVPAKGSRVLVHEQRHIRPDDHERLLTIHQQLAKGYGELREKVVAIQAFVGHSEVDNLRVALRDVLADDYRDHRNCTFAKCPWCRAIAALG